MFPSLKPAWLLKFWTPGRLCGVLGQERAKDFVLNTRKPYEASGRTGYDIFTLGRRDQNGGTAPAISDENDPESGAAGVSV